MDSIKLGVALGYISETWTPDLPDLLAEAGMSAVELAADYAADHAEAVRIRDALADAGVRINSIHAPFGSEIDPSSLDQTIADAAVTELSASLKLAQVVGASLIVVHASYEPILPAERQQRLSQAAHSLARLGEQATQLQVRVAIEWLPRSCLGNSLGELMQLCRMLPAGLGGVCLDMNHVMDRHRDLPGYIRALDQDLIAVHMSDYDGVDEKHWLPGKGVIDWAACLRELTNVQFRGTGIYETPLGAGSPRERVARWRANVDWLQNGNLLGTMTR